MSGDIRVACLYRVSTKKQLQENDIPMQKNACREFISKNPGWVLVKEYDEKGVSGYHKSAAQRDVLQLVRADAKSRLFDILLVFMFDRLGRREDETPFIVEWFVQQGVQIWSVKEGQQRFDNRVDKLMNYIRFWQSGGESEKTSIRVAEKHKQMVEEGKYRGGSPPYGYTLVDSSDKNQKGHVLKQLAIDENESQIVKMIFELATEHGYGGHRIAAYLNERNITTKNGNVWAAYGVMSLLKNPIYKGCYVSGRRKSGRGERIRTNPGEWIYSRERLTQLVIVDEKTWARAEEIRNSRNKNTGRYPIQTKSPLLFIGLVRCGHCGMMMASKYNIKKWIRKSDNMQRTYIQPTYICQRRSTKAVCSGKRTYSQRGIDPIILEEIERYLVGIPAEDMISAAERVSRQNGELRERGIREVDRHIGQVSREIESLNDEIVRCINGDSHFSAKQLSDILRQREEELEQLQSHRIELISHRTVNSTVTVEREKTEELLIDWREEFINAPQAVKKMILADLIDQIYIYEDKIEIHLTADLFRVLK